jgi:hypothetical protein
MLSELKMGKELDQWLGQWLGMELANGWVPLKVARC